MKIATHIICLKSSISAFGWKDGFGFMFRWYIFDPIKFWCYQTFHLKEWCTYNGWYCNKKECTHRHYKKFPHVKDYPIENDFVAIICEYCGIDKAKCHIYNPNSEVEEPPFYWRVCEDCREGLLLQGEMTRSSHFINNVQDIKLKESIYNKLDESIFLLKKLNEKTGKNYSILEFRKMESGKFEAKKII